MFSNLNTSKSSVNNIELNAQIVCIRYSTILTSDHYLTQISHFVKENIYF